MGVLEDAIREHLDLKRQHGAGEDELRNQEAEALGPARREDEEEPVAEAAAEAPEAGEERTHLMEVPPPEDSGPGMPFDGSEDETAWEANQGPRPEPVLEDEPFVTEEPLVAEPDPLPDPEPLADEPPPREAAMDETIAEPPLEEAPPAEEELPVTEIGSPLDEPLADEPEPLADEPEPLADEPGEEPPAQQGEDEDVLEETPDFLSETPEHDRLWFEQKPPRDFDFD
jgi:hypothetical protein